MVPESRRQAGQWLAKAQGDLDSAKILFEADPPQWETGLFHCQQAAESRYPGDTLEPAAEDIREAKKIAQEVVEFVFSKIGNG